MVVYAVLTGIFGDYWCEDVNIEGLYKYKEVADKVAEKYNSDKHAPDAVVEELNIYTKKTIKL
jgi:hypothetical protein